MRIGYACMAIGVQNTDFLSCKQLNANNEKLRKLIMHNLNSLDKVISYNVRNNIKMFRISSDLIPFGSSPVNSMPWGNEFEHYFNLIGDKIKHNQIRVSMHPGQYTVLNSKDVMVVNRAIHDLEYHNKLLDLLKVSGENKIILHIGGVYSNKPEALKRFEDNYRLLDDKLKDRIVIENDDKSYNIFDVLELGTKLGIPVVFDNLHNRINPADPKEDDNYWISECEKTWKAKDGRQKIHYSQQNDMKRPGSHSYTINCDEFVTYYNSLKGRNMDIMLEVKDKNISAVKCVNLINAKGEIKDLELEWSRYKYSVLERSPNDYQFVRNLLSHKESYPVNEFYRTIENALSKEVQAGNFVNSAQHVWGYFKEKATEKETQNLLTSLEQYKEGMASHTKIKNQLFRLAEKYQEKYLLNSYYFL